MEEVQFYKYLGVTFQCSLLWALHTEEISMKTKSTAAF